MDHFLGFRTRDVRMTLKRHHLWSLNGCFQKTAWGCTNPSPPPRDGRQEGDTRLRADSCAAVLLVEFSCLELNQALPFPGLVLVIPCLNSYSLHNIVHFQPTLPRVFRAHGACCLTRVSFPRTSDCPREPRSLWLLHQLSLWRKVFLPLPPLLCLAEFPTWKVSSTISSFNSFGPQL